MAAPVVIPHENDVLFGRGPSINSHRGNNNFRTIVEKYKHDFVTARQKDKRVVALRVVTELQNLDPPGRFLTETQQSKQQDDNTNTSTSTVVHPAILARSWAIVDLEKAIAKVSHRLREKDRTAATKEGGNNKKSSKEKKEGDSSKEKPKRKSKEPKKKGRQEGIQQKSATDDTAAKQCQSDIPKALQQEIHLSNIASMPEGIVSCTEDDTKLAQQQREDQGADFDNLSVSLSLEASDHSLLDGIDEDEDLPFDFDIEESADPFATTSNNNDDVKQHACSSMPLGKKDWTLWDDFKIDEPLENGNNHTALGGPQGEPQIHDEGHQQQETMATTATPSVAASGKVLSQGDTNHPSLDQELDSFLKAFSSEHDESAATATTGDGVVTDSAASFGNASSLQQQQPTNTFTLRQWMIMKRSNLDGNNIDTMSLDGGSRSGSHSSHSPSLQESTGIVRYVQQALIVASKLVDYLIDTNEEVEHSIPPASIAMENVLVRFKDNPTMIGQPNCNGVMEDESNIDHVFITTHMNVGGNAYSGTEMSSLFNLGCIFYELFSGEESVWLLSPGQYSAPLTMNSLDLGNGSIDENPRQRSNKKKYNPTQSSQHSHNVYAKCIVRLENRGLSYPLRTLIGNLLDCGQGDLAGDYAYKAIQDVSLDLHRMTQDPVRFLFSIETNPMPSLVLCGKLYGREEEIERLERLYNSQSLCQCNSNESMICNGVIIKGEPGVGKSRLAMHIQQLSMRSGGIFLISKFSQNKDIVAPLATISTLFNDLCDLFYQDITNSASPSLAQSLLSKTDSSLRNALGMRGAAFLASFLPSLTKVMPSGANLSPLGSTDSCIDSSLSLSFLFSELLNVISSNTNRHITIFLDDVQWSDEISLMLTQSLISSIQRGRVFFIISYRDDEVSGNSPLQQWLSSVSDLSFEEIKVKSMTTDGINSLLSETFRLSPRMTLPLASVLHHKTRGNPLFLRQLIESLYFQGLIYVNLSLPSWSWDLDRITNLKISDDVLALLIKKMQKLTTDLQLILKVAACIGACMKQPIIDILGKDLGKDLSNLLNQASTKGYMDKINNNGRLEYRYAHDKIQQAAYELIPERQRLEYHVRFGLAISHAYSMANGGEEDELFFLAVQQINRGGPETITDQAQRCVVAALNLKAGKRSIILSDYSLAFKLVRHGLSFLDQTHWETQYSLSVDLYDAASECALVLHDMTSVTFYTEALLAHAKNFEDKLNCLYCATKALSHAEKQKESMAYTLKIFGQLGEPALHPMDKMMPEIEALNSIVQGTTDETILGMATSNQKTFVALMKLYANLLHTLHLLDISLCGAASFRMLQLTLNNGLCATSPLALSFYGETQATIGNFDVACRLGGLAMKLLERKDSSRYKANVIVSVYQLIYWSSTPLQSFVDAHNIGYKAGMQSGDILYGQINRLAAILSSYISGQSLNNVRQDSLEFAFKTKFCSEQSSLLHLQACSLIDGLHILGKDRVDNVIGLKEIISNAMKRGDKSLLLHHKAHSLVRAFLFRQLDESTLEVNLSDIFFTMKLPLRPVVLFPFFFEGLISFHFARQSSDADKWIAKGELLLTKMQGWSEKCAWNWENKALLLEAAKMHTLGDFGRAEYLYKRSIRSAHEHKFIHEEAVASEETGLFYYERGLMQESHSFLMHAIKCYRKWGADAVATRVDADVQAKFGLISSSLLGSAQAIVESCLAPIDDISNKRREM